ncbi:MAG: ADP-forming succinate--CoA ligase subunit beta [Thermoprotei archaeon]
MKLFEYEAKQVFASKGIPAPKGVLARDPERAAQAYSDLGSEQVALKAQVLVGGRGKAGGIRFASSQQEARSVARELLGSSIKGETVRTILVEPKLKIVKELYVGVTLDRSKRAPVVVASSSGGVEIEEAARASPETVKKMWVDPDSGFPPFQGRRLGAQIGLKSGLLQKFGDIASALYALFEQYDAELVESNPLAVTDGDRLVAADARLNISDDALYRHTQLELSDEDRLASLSELEKRAHRLGVQYVELDGDVGVIGNGAGLTMATLDMVKYFGGNPANFLDAGGGSSQESFASALSILNDNPRIKVIFINILAGITRCDEVAKAIVEARKTLDPSKKLVIRLSGTNEEKGKSILSEHSIRAFTDMEQAAREAVRLAGGAQ